ncbi:MAG: beta-ketoacyl synthase N-terminal-like domain-containing protein, partial [Planctomycetota bacterium]
MTSEKAHKDPRTQELLRRAIDSVAAAEARIEELERDQRVPLAIVGMACRLPGGVHDPAGYWRLLAGGVDAIARIPAERWDADAHYDPDPAAPGRSIVREGGFVEGIERFDPEFFGISPREALRIDPQHRLLLQLSWEALERAGLAADRLRGSRTGVFVGVTTSDYGELLHADGHSDAYVLTGNALNFAAGRVSYAFDFRGPALAVDTACSSSLVSTHLACRSLRERECDLALAAGVNALLSPHGNALTSSGRMLSPTARCHTFDEDADGTIRGEGCGVVALKRLADAIADGDPIVAVIHGSAVNHDGASGGLTIPSRFAQEEVVRAALADGGIAADELDYVEAHGTGTPLGDPIELRALAASLGAAERERPLLVGSVKTNVGHLESAAGVAGLIKVALALRHNAIPPHRNLVRPTSRVDWGELGLDVPRTLRPWPGDDAGRPRRAGLSSFGGSGTNAHLVLGEAPREDERPRPAPNAQDAPNAPGAPERTHELLPLSARTPEALDALAARHADALEALGD